MTLLCSSPCICRLSQACILRETSTKPLRMLTHLLTVFSVLLHFLTASSCQLCLLQTAISSRLFPSALLYQLNLFWLSSLPSFHLLIADCVLLWTAISSRLFSSATLCQLTFSVFSGTSLPSSTSFVWVSRHLAYIFYSSVYDQFLLWHHWFLCVYFVQSSSKVES